MAEDVQAVMAALHKVTTRLVQQITLDVQANLIETTPVDTGWAKNNWVPHIGGPVDVPAGSRENVGPAAAASEAGKAEVLTAYTLDKGPIYVSNNVPYIGSLNDGHSKQAPAGFVQAAILKAVTEDIKKIAT